MTASKIGALRSALLVEENAQKVAVAQQSLASTQAVAVASIDEIARQVDRVAAGGGRGGRARTRSS